MLYEVITQFEDAAKEKLITKLKDEMVLEPAPSFTLTDIDGNDVGSRVRITSYNVCYTKLLRSLKKYLAAFRFGPPGLVRS